MAKADSIDRVLVGQIGAPHGVRGLLRLRSFTADPDALLDYGPVCDPAGAELSVTLKGHAKGSLVVAIDGVADRDAAQALKGTRLYIDRAALPAPEAGEFYQADLLGLKCELEDGTPYGEIKAVEDFGAGDLLEIKPAAGGPTIYLPFSAAVVPLVDIDNGRVVVVPPDSVGEVEGVGEVAVGEPEADEA